MKHHIIKINCYFSTHKHLAYKSTFSEGDNLRHDSDWQCLTVQIIIVEKINTAVMLDKCSGIPRVICDFDTQN